MEHVFTSSNILPLSSERFINTTTKQTFPLVRSLHFKRLYFFQKNSTELFLWTSIIQYHYITFNLKMKILHFINHHYVECRDTIVPRTSRTLIYTYKHLSILVNMLFDQKKFILVCVRALGSRKILIYYFILKYKFIVLFIAHNASFY